jgi:hypothetical protein
MNKIDFNQVGELIKKEGFVDSCDEVIVNADGCSLRIISINPIDQDCGLTEECDESESLNSHLY